MAVAACLGSASCAKVDDDFESESGNDNLKTWNKGGTIDIAGVSFSKYSAGLTELRIKSDMEVNDESLCNSIVFVNPKATLSLGPSAKLDNTVIISSKGQGNVVLDGMASGKVIALKDMKLSGHLNIGGSIDNYLFDGCEILADVLEKVDDSEDSTDVFESVNISIGNISICNNCIHAASAAGNGQYAILDADGIDAGTVSISDNMIMNVAGPALVTVASAGSMDIERNYLRRTLDSESYVLCVDGDESSDIKCMGNTVYPTSAKDFRPYRTPSCEGRSFRFKSDPLASVDVSAGEYSYVELVAGIVSDFDSEGSCEKEETFWTKSGSDFSLRHCPYDVAFDVLAMPGVAADIAGSCGRKTLSAEYGSEKRSYTLSLPDYVTDSYDAWELEWADEFNGEDYDHDVWTRCPKQTSDWNRCQEPDDASLVAVADGVLTLYARYYADDTSKGRDGYATGGIWGLNLKSFNLGNGITSGRIDVAAKMTDATGYWPAIWMMPEQKSYSWPQWGEIDIMEHLNSQNIYYATLHTYRDGELNKGSYTDYSESATRQIPNRNSTWHVFSVIVNSEKIQLLLDGKSVLTCRKSDHGIDDASSMEDRKNYWPFDATEYYLILDSQVGGGWVGSPVASSYSDPAHMDIDYVRYMVRK